MFAQDTKQLNARVYSAINEETDEHDGLVIEIVGGGWSHAAKIKSRAGEPVSAGQIATVLGCVADSFGRHDPNYQSPRDIVKGFGTLVGALANELDAADKKKAA